MQAAWRHILETSTVTITSEATGYPGYRLYDRLFAPGRPWKATSTATQTITVDQGSIPLPVDALIVPKDHLLSGGTLTGEHSVNGSDWSAMNTPFAQADSDTIISAATTEQTKRYLRLTISGASVAVEAAEIFMAKLHTLTNPIYGARRSTEAVVSRVTGMDGSPRFTVNGNPQRILGYSIKTAEAAEKALWIDLADYWAQYHRPLFLVDSDGAEGWFEFVQAPDITDASFNVYLIDAKFRQVF